MIVKQSYNSAFAPWHEIKKNDCEAIITSAFAPLREIKKNDCEAII
jgi:hypothetical protein